MHRDLPVARWPLEFQSYSAMCRSSMRRWLSVMQWSILIFGAVALYFPVYIDLLRGGVVSGAQSQAPLVALIAAWSIWRRRSGLVSVAEPKPMWGWPVLSVGLAIYCAGSAIGSVHLQMASQIPVLMGTLLCVGGFGWLRTCRFALIFLLLAMPLPGQFATALTLPLKIMISELAEIILHQLGFPIARMGTVLVLSQYRLLVTDACSGLHSLFSLGAMGLLFIHLRQRVSRLHNALLFISIAPVALIANLLRVLVLLLITYYFGDAIGQGPAHETVGVCLFIFAFLLLLSLDAVLIRFLSGRKRGALALQSQVRVGALRWGWIGTPFIAVALFTGTPHSLAVMSSQSEQIRFDAKVPLLFSGWKADAIFSDAIVSVPAYSQTLARTYVDATGRKIMLVIAYGPDQLHEKFQIHRPEFCYEAQGFEVKVRGESEIETTKGMIPVRQLIARRAERIELVTYWLMLGDKAVLPGFQRKLAQMQYALTGSTPDGRLIRVSSIGGDIPAAFAMHNQFIQALQSSVVALPSLH